MMNLHRLLTLSYLCMKWNCSG